MEYPIANMEKLMLNSIVTFDQHQDISSITHTLHQVSLMLLPSTYQSLSISENERDDRLLDAVSELTYADFRHHERPVFLLSEICRLLIKKGDHRSFKRCLDMSYKIYAFKTQLNESWYISYLYKGIAQIGMGTTDTGITNVIFALSEHSDMEICPEDEALGYWAIMSAAISNRNIEMALKFAIRWQKAATMAGLKSEIFRSRLAIQVLHLLFGDQEACYEGLATLGVDAPASWQPVEAHIRQWTHSLLSGSCLENRDDLTIEEPFPLFAGVKWRRTSSLPPDREVGDFAFLCQLRRDYCNAVSIEALSAQQIERYAEQLALWELPIPLREFETRMREKDPGVYHQFAMTRVLGKYRTMSVFRKESKPSEVTLRNDAILLTMDIRKFSTMCEKYPPQKIFEIINPLFRIMNEELEKAGGSILEYEGDCIIVAFNTFEGQKSDIKDILSRAVNCLRQVRIHSALSLQAGLPPLDIGIGIAQGTVAMGYVGGLSRCHLTLIGNAINLSARIESETKDSPSPILVSRACFGDKNPEIWTQPENVMYSFRDLSERPIKNMQPVSLYGIAPLLAYRVDFVPMGFVARTERGVVYIDTGNAAGLGVIDHHYPGCEAGSACELLLRNPRFLLDHLRDLADAEIEFRLHAYPDIDCVAALYTAFELMTLEKFHRREALEKIADYVSRVDQGTIPDPGHLDHSFYGIFMAHQARMQKAHFNRVRAGREKSEKIHLTLLRAGLRVMDAAISILEHLPFAEPSSVFIHRQNWFIAEQADIRTDRSLYEADLSHPESENYTARINVGNNGETRRVAGLWLANPRSAFFKQWVRNDCRAPSGRGYPLMTIDRSESGRNRFIISVDPESGTNLKGLGEILEKRESEKRKALGKERPIHPVRPPADNADPWYFGQGHRYTIVDSPRDGSVLTAEEVKSIIQEW